jgi:hypothetical protein
VFARCRRSSGRLADGELARRVAACRWQIKRRPAERMHTCRRPLVRAIRPPDPNEPDGGAATCLYAAIRRPCL